MKGWLVLLGILGNFKGAIDLVVVLLVLVGVTVLIRSLRLHCFKMDQVR